MWKLQLKTNTVALRHEVPRERERPAETTTLVESLSATTFESVAGPHGQPIASAAQSHFLLENNGTENLSKKKQIKLKNIKCV